MTSLKNTLKHISGIKLCSPTFCFNVSGQYQVVGSTQAIVAAPGYDVILPCYVKPPLNVKDYTVDWWRPDIPPDFTDPLSQYRYVHHYHEKHDFEDNKMSSYFGRTAIFKDELKNGNASLKVMNVTLSDQGWYRCILPQLGRSTDIKLTVGKYYLFVCSKCEEID